MRNKEYEALWWIVFWYRDMILKLYLLGFETSLMFVKTEDDPLFSCTDYWQLLTNNLLSTQCVYMHDFALCWLVINCTRTFLATKTCVSLYSRIIGINHRKFLIFWIHYTRFSLREDIINHSLIVFGLLKWIYWFWSSKTFPKHYRSGPFEKSSFQLAKADDTAHEI